jgi:hypothetical protein
VLDHAERVIEESTRERNAWQPNRVNPLPSTKGQLKRARKVKHLQEARDNEEAGRNQRLEEIRAEAISHLSKENDLWPYALNTYTKRQVYC